MIAHVRHRDVYLMSLHLEEYFLVFAHLQYVYKTFPVRCQIDV